MTLSRSDHARLEAEMRRLKELGVPFAMATIVRTVDATSAKPGGKALLDQKGNLIMGWVGGGCARGAVGSAAREAIESGEPKFISLRPQELLETEGVAAGDVRNGVKFARNGCPSKGTMDLFVEPVLPLPEMVICGTGLVAMALAELAASFDFTVSIRSALPVDDGTGILQGFDFETRGYVVVATQGQGDADALRAAISDDRAYISFVGSRKKFNTIVGKLTAENPKLESALKNVHAPAGLDINAITPNEIALSILSEITQIRRAARMCRSTNS